MTKMVAKGRITGGMSTWLGLGLGLGYRVRVLGSGYRVRVLGLGLGLEVSVEHEHLEDEVQCGQVHKPAERGDAHEGHPAGREDDRHVDKSVHDRQHRRGQAHLDIRLGLGLGLGSEVGLGLGCSTVAARRTLTLGWG